MNAACGFEYASVNQCGHRIMFKEDKEPNYGIYILTLVEGNCLGKCFFYSFLPALL